MTTLLDQVARALCGCRNADPDLLVPIRISGNSFVGAGGSLNAVTNPTHDYDNRHPLWHHFTKDAAAALTAMKEFPEVLK